MSTTNITIQTDSEIKAKAQEIFAILGLDMTSAVNLFLRQTVHRNDLPFGLTTQEPQPEKKPKMSREEVFGCMRGQFNIPDDFDAPLEDFKEYME